MNIKYPYILVHTPYKCAEIAWRCYIDLFEFGIQCYSQAIEIWCVLVTGVETEKFHNSSAWLCLFFFLSACACMVPVHVIMPEYSLDEFFFVSLIQVLLIQSVEHCFSLHFVTIHSLALDFSPFFSWKKYISSIMCMAAKKKKKKKIKKSHWGCISTNNKPHLVAGIYCTLHLIIPRFSLRHYRATNIKWSLVMTSRRETVLWSNHTVHLSVSQAIMRCQNWN